MKILIISDAWHPQLNGVVRTYEYLIPELEKKGHEVTVIGPRNFKHHFPMPGYKEIDLVPFSHKSMAKKIKNAQADTIHIATEGPLGWIARRYCMKNNIKFTTCYHTQFPDYIARRFSKFLPFLYTPVRNIGKKFIKKFHTPSSALLVSTQSMRDELTRWGVKTPIFPFTKGVDLSVFCPGKKPFFQNLKQPVALYVGRLAIEKNIKNFLKMDWSGSKIVVGHGPDANLLLKKYPNVLFTGKKTGKNLVEYYRAADVFVFPSTTDTFGMVLIEALACGIPVAAYNVTGPRDIITDPKLGCLDDNLATAAQKTMTEGTAQDRFNHVKENYSWALAADDFLKASET